MTRKTYEKKMKALLVAIYNHPESHFPEDYKIGEALKHYNAKTIDLSKVGGSYKAAWNVFGKSYEYRQKYKDYKAKRMEAEKNPGQYSLFEM